MNIKNKDLESSIYMWLNMKYELFNKLDHNNSIYLYYEGHEYADIRIEKEHKNIYYNMYFKNEFFEVFPIGIVEFKQVMAKWVGDTFGLKGFTSYWPVSIKNWLLEIPK